LPSQPQNTVTKTCGIPANAGSAGGFSARAKGAQPKTQQTPASCRKQCGSDTLCYICCLHPDPSHCF
jgi:hypothetical protein